MDQFAGTALYTLEYCYREPLLKLIRYRKKLMKRGNSPAREPDAKPVKLEREKFARHMAALYGGGAEKWEKEFDLGKAKRAEWDRQNGR